jgi:hypothetical protein
MRPFFTMIVIVKTASERGQTILGASSIRSKAHNESR